MGTGAFDSHCHLNDPRLAGMAQESLRTMPALGLCGVLVPGYDLVSSRAALNLVQYGAVAAVGLHPHDAAKLDEFLPELPAMLAQPGCVALGEIGLDYHYDNTDRGAQKKAFEAQLDAAVRAAKPVIFHSRDATADVMATLREWAPRLAGGVMHCFSGSVETAHECLDLGLYISLAGPVTFPKAHNLHEVAAYVPADRLLIETDAPYLTPAPHRGEMNLPQYVRLVGEKVAELRGVAAEEIFDLTARNVRELFGL